MNTRVLSCAVLMLAADAAGAGAQGRAIMIEARNLAYDANYRNDRPGLELAIKALEPVTQMPERAHAHYYLSWTHGALSTSQFFAADAAAARESAHRALEHARLAIAGRETDPEFQVALANALVGVMLLDRPQFAKIYGELKQVRQRALDLGPRNPRVVLMDAGMIFNDPSETNGPERGVARIQEAIRLFEAEADERTIDPIAPRWGHAAAYSMLANFYTRLSPPKNEEARKAAAAALRLRPDFWFVREQVLPKLVAARRRSPPQFGDAHW